VYFSFWWLCGWVVGWLPAVRCVELVKDWPQLFPVMVESSPVPGTAAAALNVM